MGTSRTLFLVRHGQTEWNAERRMQGQLDSPLTPLGRRQAETNGQFLSRFDIGHIYASPLGRVRKTLEIAQRHLDVPVTFDDRLMEWNSGQWSSHLYTELPWRWPQEFAEWEDDRYWVRPPMGENYPDMLKRAGSVLDAVLRDPTPSIAIFSHGMVGRALLAVLLGLSEKDVLSVRQRNDIIIRVTMEEDRRTADYFISARGPFPHLPLEG